MKSFLTLIFFLFFILSCRAQFFEEWNRTVHGTSYNNENLSPLAHYADSNSSLYNLKGNIKAVYYYLGHTQAKTKMGEVALFEKGKEKYNIFYCKDDSCFSESNSKYKDTIILLSKLDYFNHFGSIKSENKVFFTNIKTGWLDSISFSSGSKVYYKYNFKDSIIIVGEFSTGYIGQIKSCKLDKISKRIIEKSSFMDFNGHFTKEADNIESFEYDNKGRLIERIELSNFIQTIGCT